MSCQGVGVKTKKLCINLSIDYATGTLRVTMIGADSNNISWSQNIFVSTIKKAFLSF